MALTPFPAIIPAFVLKDGKPWLSFGVMGGGMQPQSHVQILVNLIDYGMHLQEAGDAVRIITMEADSRRKSTSNRSARSKSSRAFPRRRSRN